MVRVAIGLCVVAAATALLVALDIDRLSAAFAYMVVIVGLAFAGVEASIVGVIAASGAENYFFTSPYHSFQIKSTDDVVALVAFGITAAIVSVTVAQLNDLRRRADVRAQEAGVRLALQEELFEGRDEPAVVAAAERALSELFGLEECEIDLNTGTVTMRAPGRRSIPDDDRAVIHAFVVGLATTADRVRLDHEAERARVAASEEAGRASFLSAMTHNLRTPLASINSAIGTLRSSGDRLDDEARVELYATAQDEAERLERLVGKVLELSRIRAGVIVPRRELVDVIDLAARALHRVQWLAAGREVRLDAEPDIRLVDVDPTLVEFALSCLLENALRYAPDSPEIVVEIRRFDGGFEIAVIDHGPGIPEAERAQVFEEFARGETLQDTVGSGLGLPIASAFVAAHGGSVRLDETPGGGATFAMRFPAGEARS